MGRGNNPEELALAKKLTPSLSELAFKLLANLLNRRIYALLLSQKSQIKIFLKAHFQATKKFSTIYSLNLKQHTYKKMVNLRIKVTWIRKCSQKSYFLTPKYSVIFHFTRSINNTDKKEKKLLFFSFLSLFLTARHQTTSTQAAATIPTI